MTENSFHEKILRQVEKERHTSWDPQTEEAAENWNVHEEQLCHTLEPDAHQLMAAHT